MFDIFLINFAAKPLQSIFHSHLQTFQNKCKNGKVQDENKEIIQFDKYKIKEYFFLLPEVLQQERLPVFTKSMFCDYSFAVLV